MYVVQIQISKKIKKQYFARSLSELVDQIRNSLTVPEVIEFVEKQLLIGNFKTETLKVNDVTISCSFQEPPKNETSLKLPPELESAIKSKIMLSLIQNNKY